jgi:hypothetical protein
LYLGGGGSGGLVLIVAENVLGKGEAGGISTAGAVQLESSKFTVGGAGGRGHIIIRSPNCSAKLGCFPEPKIENNLDFPDLSTLLL